MIAPPAEIAALVRRAGLGRGWCHAMADEAGRAAAALAAAGLDGPAAAVAALQVPPAAARVRGAQLSGPVIAIGPAAVDLLRVGAAVTVVADDPPDLLLGHLIDAAAAGLGAFSVAGCGWRAETGPPLFSDGRAEAGAALALSRSAGPRLALSPAGVAVDDADWEALARLGIAATVPPSDRSRSGAGAAGNGD